MSTLLQLRTTFRTTISDDTDSRKYRWSDAELNTFANRVVNDICRIGRVIKDGVTTAITRITIVAGTQNYALHDSIIDIEDGDVRLSTLQKELKKYSYRDFQDASPTWTTDASEPQGFCLDWQTGYLTLDCLPEASDTALLRVVRLPLADMELDTDSPDIPRAYQDFIPEMMAYYAYQKQDAETLEPKKVEKYFNLCFNSENPNSYMERIKRMELAKRTGRAQSVMPPHMGCM